MHINIIYRIVSYHIQTSVDAAQQVSHDLMAPDIQLVSAFCMSCSEAIVGFGRLANTAF